MSCRALNQNELVSVDQACDGDVINTTAIRLYLSQSQREYTYTSTGAIALVRHRNGTFYFKMVDLRTGRGVWESPIIGDIKYIADRPFFHSFVGQVSRKYPTKS